ncbi:SAM-dependent chlorinase/fluorinase [Microcoleus sp. FACHB-831]|uniref:SAM hydrolase/SAM-dependent halogenase family protein n=1 Tax=Microcoleus sp. FACHB-831 TaxID=2692827 RepID=UPI0016874EA6|nr:SAM-dependent chlorinase/fluorinase [Microcoleus sp. FACHB-831]MBD1920269.1 SAM-dependent chlorinase/fluorinase [Microcoleus sp. FACHB-831]
MLVHIIADYGFGDLAFAEVVQRIKFYLPDAEPILTPVPPFATIAAGFCIAQLGLNEAPAGTIIYHNVAPREDDEQARAANAGERLAFARLPTGVRVIGVNAGYAYSFVRDVAEDLRWAAVPAEGSQFRSRDLFPQAAAAIALGQPDAIAEKIPASDIPDVPQNCIAYIDGYGNLKTTIKHDGKIRDGAAVHLQIGDKEMQAIASDGSFAVESGQLAFAPGSSGWTNAQGEEMRWMELFLRGGNAWESFARPSVGTSIQMDYKS